MSPWRASVLLTLYSEICIVQSNGRRKPSLTGGTMEESGPNAAAPPFLHLVSAFLAMEPTETLLFLARDCGGGLVTKGVQRFVWEHCISKAVGGGYAPYMKSFLKKLMTEVESNDGAVLDELYEQYAYYMISSKDDNLIKGNTRVCKCISFLFSDGCLELQSCPKSRKLIVPLQCSLNMLEGDTGCSVWPSSLFLSEIILSYPDIFANKSCFEVGSGVGLVGICLAHVKASKVILSDGDLSTLANMKLNCEMNKLNGETDMSGHPNADRSVVECIYLPWESASESKLLAFMPDIILAADVIYDIACLPHLIRVIANLLSQRKLCPKKQKESCQGISLEGSLEQGKGLNGYDGTVAVGSREGRVAYIASVIRNIDTFNHFLKLAEQANLSITDLTGLLRPISFLPYMQSYDRTSIRLFRVSCK